MAASRKVISFRSVTYPSPEQVYEKTGKEKRNRGKLERTISIDDDYSLGGSQQPLHVPPYMHSTNKLQVPISNDFRASRSMSKGRDLSLEGHLRVAQFKQTHSATSPLAPSKKLLRFSDGSLGKPTSSHQNFGQNMRSASCARLSRKGSPSPQTSNTNLERLVDWQRLPLDRSAIIPPTTHDARSSNLSGKPKSKKLERFHSTDGQEAGKSSKSPSRDINLGAGSASSGNSETRSRRSQFRRAMSLFSISCDKTADKEKKAKSPPQKILRPPTRHTYRRGLSGLPIQCNSNTLGVVY